MELIGTMPDAANDAADRVRRRRCHPENTRRAHNGNRVSDECVRDVSPISAHGSSVRRNTAVQPRALACEEVGAPLSTDETGARQLQRFVGRRVQGGSGTGLLLRSAFASLMIFRRTVLPGSLVAAASASRVDNTRLSW